ncbi:MAG: hypothetical protein ACYC2T_00230 [Bacillota bacterium]
MMRWLKNEQGAAMVATMVVLTVVLTLGTFLLEISTTEVIISRNQVNEVKAMNVAEGGAEKLLAGLEAEKVWRESWEEEFAGFVIGDGYIESLELVDEPATLKATVWGAVGIPGSEPRARRALVTRISKPVYNYALAGINPDGGWEFTGPLEISGDVAVDGNLTMAGGTSINGKMVVSGSLVVMTGGFLENGSVLVGGNLNNSGTISPLAGQTVEVAGNLTNDGSIEAPGGQVRANGNLINNRYIRADYDFGRIIRAGYLTGKQLQPKPPPVLSFFPVRPDVDLLWYEVNASVIQEGSYVMGSGDLDQFTGIYFVDGELTISSDISVSENLLIAVTGDVYIQGNLQVAGEGGLAVIAGGNIATGPELHLEGIYMSQSFQANGRLDVSGSVVTGALTIEPEGARFTYSQELVAGMAGWLPDYRYEMVLWQELYPIFY